MSLNQKGDGFSTEPRAIVHKRILDAARSDSTATIEEIAERAGGVSADLVERVFDEYGDPGIDPDDSGGVGDPDAAEASDGDGGPTVDIPNGGIQEAGDETMPNGEASHVSTDAVNWSDLSRKQKETLRAIYENPEATQTELGEIFNVSKSTICQRVNSIDGFNWQVRGAFVKSIFDGELDGGVLRGTDEEREPIPRADLVVRVEELSRRIDSVQQRLRDDRESPDTVLADPDVNHKIVHACIKYREIDDYEVKRLLEEVIRACSPDATASGAE